MYLSTFSSIYNYTRTHKFQDAHTSTYISIENTIVIRGWRISGYQLSYSRNHRFFIKEIS